MSVKTITAFLAARGRSLLSLGAPFWFFLVGLAMVARGASLVHPAAGWLLAGLLLVWDATRVEPPNPPPRR